MMWLLRLLGMALPAAPPPSPAPLPAALPPPLAPVLAPPPPANDRPPVSVPAMPKASRLVPVAAIWAVAPTVKDPERWSVAMSAACERFSINTVDRISDHLGQTGHESGGFRNLVEGLNYTPKALRDTFNRKTTRISFEDSERYGRTTQRAANQQAIANIVYGGKFGREELGNVLANDGWMTRGRGTMQITGRSNYEAVARAMGMSFDEMPAYLETIEGACVAGAWWWQNKGLNALSDARRFNDLTARINKAKLGLEERRALAEKARKALA